jgi:hypothetical protein
MAQARSNTVSERNRLNTTLHSANTKKRNKLVDLYVDRKALIFSYILRSFVQILVVFLSISLIPCSCGVDVFFFHFPLDLYIIGRTPWTSDRLVARPLHKWRTAQTQNKRAHIHTHTHTQNIHVRSGIRTNYQSVRTSKDNSCLEVRSHRDSPRLRETNFPAAQMRSQHKLGRLLQWLMKKH